jgi:predicted metal-binding membrane protein
VSIGATIVSLIWFVVRVGLEMPTSTPLFSGTTFAYADTIFAVAGIAGLGFFLAECFSS